MKTIFVNGCFDVLHRGHIELFKYAKSMGDRLVVALDSDKKVSEDKGPTRPINVLVDRIEMLRSIRYIDLVENFNSREELESLVEKWRPDVLVVGSDWKGKDIVGASYAKEIKYFGRIDGYSTTRILENSSNR